MGNEFCPHGMPRKDCIKCNVSSRITQAFSQMGQFLSHIHDNLEQENTARQAVIERIAKTRSIIRRSAWGKLKPKHSSMEWDWDYTTVVIHHSGNDGEKDPKKIEDMHMNKNKWDDIGYHYLIPPSGSIHEGRDLRFKGSHVALANTQKIGILIMGDFEPNWWDFSDDEPCSKQLSSAVELILTLKSEFPTLNELGGHRDYKKGTECPGSRLYAQLKDLRTKTRLSEP